MNKDKLIKEFKNLMKNKNVSNLVLIILVLLFVLIAVNVFMPKATLTSSNSTNVDSNNTEKLEEKISKTISNYEDDQKKDLINILKKIKGAGNVECNIQFESGEIKVPAYNKTNQTTKTEETDNEGGKRVNNQENDGTTVVMSTNNGDSEPFILETYKPKVLGIIIVADGAKDSKIKNDIQNAAMGLYDLPANKVHVYTMN